MSVVPVQDPRVTSASVGRHQRAPSVGSGFRRRRRGDGRAAVGFLAPTLLGFLAFTLLPTIASFVLSLFNYSLVASTSFTGLENYIHLFADPVFRSSLYNTLYFVIAYTVVCMLLALGTTLWVSSKHIMAKGIYRVLFFIPVVTPIVANALIWSLLFSPNNGIATWLGDHVIPGFSSNPLGSPTLAMPVVIIMSIWQGFGYNMLILTAGLESIPQDYFEAARIDGAGRWRTLISVKLPLLSPVLFFTITLTLINSFQVFTQPYVLTGGGPGDATTTMVLYMYERGFEAYQMGYASAIAWILFLIILVLTVLQFRVRRRWVFYES